VGRKRKKRKKRWANAVVRRVGGKARTSESLRTDPDSLRSVLEALSTQSSTDSNNDTSSFASPADENPSKTESTSSGSETGIALPVQVFDWDNEVDAVQFVERGGIAVLLVPPEVNVEGKKRRTRGGIVIGENRDVVEIVCGLVGMDVGRIKKVSGRWCLGVGGKWLRRVLKLRGENG